MHLPRTLCLLEMTVQLLIKQMVKYQFTKVVKMLYYHYQVGKLSSSGKTLSRLMNYLVLLILIKDLSQEQRIKELEMIIHHIQVMCGCKQINMNGYRKYWK